MMNYQNSYAKLDPRLYHRQPPTPLTNPRAGHFNPEVAEQLGWSEDDQLMSQWVDILGGHVIPDGFEPLAMAYAGHQFGQWAGQLGDGRGLLMAQVMDQKGQLRDLHLKGCGLTPYSRMGDGRAVLRSTIREYLCGHALTQLGIASSNALGFVVSDTPVRRETMEQGAALMRVADSHVRLGHIEWIASFAPDLLAEFTDYMIDTYYPECRSEANPIAAFLTAVVTRTAKMIADWQLIGFAHGVMNTDNLSITGSTLDFGPFGFMERFNPGWINNHSDHTGRYSYQNQPAIGHWNLNIWLPHFMRLPTISRDTLADCLAPYETVFMSHYQQGLCQKLGLSYCRDSLALALEWLTLLEDHQLDYTNSFRALIGLLSQIGLDKQLLGISPCDHDIKSLAVLESELNQSALEQWQDWQTRYLNHLYQSPHEDSLNTDKDHESLQSDHTNSTSNHATTNETTTLASDHPHRQSETSLTAALSIMAEVNPVYVLRNNMAQRAIEQAQIGNFAEVDRLYQLLARPYQVQSIAQPADITPPAPDAPALPISCSS